MICSQLILYACIQCKMSSSLDILPWDIKKYVLRPFLDISSLFSIRIAFYGRKAIRKECFTDEMIKSIIFHGLPFTLYFLDYFDDRYLAIYAAKVGSVDVLRYAHQNNYSWSPLIADNAAFNGHLSILQYIYEEGPRLSSSDPYWGINVINGAVEGGHIDVVRYLHEKGCFWSLRTCEKAAYYGYLEILRYLIEPHSCIIEGCQGCPWPINACAVAATSGQLHIVKYIHEKGLSYNADACHIAAKNGHMNIVKYICENSTQWSHSTTIRNAAEATIWIFYSIFTKKDAN